LDVKETLHRVVEPVNRETILAGNARGRLSNRLAIGGEIRIDILSGLPLPKHEGHIGTTHQKNLTSQAAFVKVTADQSQVALDRLAVNRP